MRILAVSGQGGAPQPVLARLERDRVVRESAAGPGVDYAQVARRLDSLEARFARELSDALKASRSALLDLVRSAPAAVDGLVLPGKDAVAEAFRDSLLRAWDAGAAAARGEVSGARSFAEPTFTPVSALRWLREKAFWASGIAEDQLEAEVKGILLNALKTGEALSVTIDRVSEAFGPYLLEGTQDAPLPGARIETIVRTNTTEAYNHGRLIELLDAKMAPFVDGVRYSAVLDSRTTEVCRFLDGRVFRLSEGGGEGDQLEDLLPLLPPNHFNCRSIIVGVVAGEEIDPGAFITADQVREARALADQKFLAEWEETKHPRHEKGDSRGGEFAPSTLTEAEARALTLYVETAQDYGPVASAIAKLPKFSGVVYRGIEVGGAVDVDGSLDVGKEFSFRNKISSFSTSKNDALQFTRTGLGGQRVLFEASVRSARDLSGFIATLPKALRDTIPTNEKVVLGGTRFVVASVKKAGALVTYVVSERRP